MRKRKGPYTQNFCICADGRKAAVMAPNGSIRSKPCGSQPSSFCAAFRASWAQALARERMYIANIFSRDLYLWDRFENHHDLVRGYILEKYFTETNPDHKLSKLRAFGGLSGAEYEAVASTRFFERYLALPDFDDARHFLLAYELQKRFFVRQDQGQIQEVRAMATRIQRKIPRFKPLRDATHNQISAALLPRLGAFRDGLPEGSARAQVEALMAEIEKLTSLGAAALEAQLAEIEDLPLRERLASGLPPPGADAIGAISSLARLMVLVRRSVAARQISPADARRLIDLDITAATVIQRRGAEFLDAGERQPVRRNLELLSALADAAYGAGLLLERERAAAAGAIGALLAAGKHQRRDFDRGLEQAQRIVEWAQNTALSAFAEVRAPWNLLLPETALVGDDILRGSPLLLFARVSQRLADHASGADPDRHEIFGARVARGVRALNPGLALGRLRVAPEPGSYSRDELVALTETPAELQPAAGILTQGEGNVVSHVQLLARALGIPNVVVGPAVFREIEARAGRDLLLAVTPGGRVLLKQASAMTPRERAIQEEYHRNTERTSDGSLGSGARKLHIDRARLDLAATTLLDLASVRRPDSGIRSGPKAAFLGELRHLFPDKVARGVVVPFGVYHEHYRRATVAVPPALGKRGIAQAGQPLSDFVEATYAQFFDVMIPAGTPEKELSAWIRPRLEIIQHSIQSTPLSEDLRRALRDELARQRLLHPADPSQTVGCFVRSDTNVEDLDNFNGAGLNLTLFNLRSLEDIYQGIKRVWASPFSYRSFSWRQTLIDQPLWVLPSIVILESVPSEKSGVLVTADIDHGDSDKMLVATSEGVGGAVDGTPAETLLWSPQGVELVTMFKSPWRRLLLPSGGSKLVSSTGRQVVLEPRELEELIDTARTIQRKLEPARDALGRERPWDIEFGFAGGKLWLFQVRPFIGNDEVQNVPALAALDHDGGRDREKISLEEVLP